MGDFFGSIYCIFEDFFGLDLANYMWGQSSPNMTNNEFIPIGLVTMLLALAFVLAFYYVINKPSWNHWWCWLLTMLTDGIIGFIVGWQWLLNDSYGGKMVDASGNDLQISDADIVYFGVTNLVISMVVFFIFSMIFKWWSNNVARAPFVK